MDDHELVARLRAGDEGAFAMLVRQHQPSLLRLAEAPVGSRAVAEEVVQDTWLAADRARQEAHLAECQHCSEHLAQLCVVIVAAATQRPKSCPMRQSTTWSGKVLAEAGLTHARTADQRPFNLILEVRP